MENQVLLIALALVSLITGVALFVNWASNRHIPGLLKIAIGYAATSSGILLVCMQSTLMPVLSIFVANGLIMGGRLPMLSGLAGFWNQEKTRLPLFCLVWFLGTMAGYYYFTFIDESMLWRLRIYTVMMVIFSLCTAYILIKGLRIEHKLRPVMAITTNFGAYILLTLSCFNAVTEFTLMFFRDGASISEPGTATTVLLLGSIVNMLIFTLSILIMSTEELTVEYQENAIYDPITTILNHRTFLEVCNRVLGVALRYTKPVSMLTIAIVNLDDIIKQHGVEVGNKLLRHFALMATDRRRNEDVLARSSYNEFHMLLPGVDEQGARIVIQKIQKAVAGEEYVYRGAPLRAEFLISSVTKREEDLHLQQMLQEGEVDLLRLKQAQKSL
jgi:diguanylate cyclase (GGDEF)-like protein